MNQSIAYETVLDERNPSPHKGDVWKWIVWPAIFAFFSALAWGVGAGLIVSATANGKTSYFIWGCGFFSAGLVGLLTIAIKSFSFDKTDITRSKTTTPIFYTNEDTPGQNMSGNRPITVSSQPVIVEYDKQKYTWSKEQLNRMQDRLESGNFTISRDYFKIASGDYPTIKYIMTNCGLWYEENNNTFEWSDDGITWHGKAMRKIAPH